MIKIPKKITPCPIAEATVEFRFATDLKADLLFAKTYAKLETSYPNYTDLEILRLPSNILEQDINLQYQPYRKFIGDSFTIQLGARVLSVTAQAPYSGWAIFRQECEKARDILNQIGAIYHIERLGLRYINIFESIDVFENIRISSDVSLEQPAFKQGNSYFRTLFGRDNFGCLLQVSNELVQQEQQLSASMIDIDISLSGDYLLQGNILDSLDTAHTIEKELFFGLLHSEYLETFTCEY